MQGDFIDRPDCTPAIQALLDSGESVDLSVFNGYKIGRVRTEHLTETVLANSADAAVFVDTQIDSLYGCFDLPQDCTNPQRRSFYLQCDAPLKVFGNDGDRHFFHHRVYSDCEGMQNQITQGVEFDGFRHGAGIKVMHARRSLVYKCKAKNFIGSGTLHHFNDSQIDAPQDIETIDCEFENVEAPTAQATRAELQNVVKKHAPRIKLDGLVGRGIKGRWKAHAPVNVTMIDCDMKSASGNQWGGFNLVPNVLSRGFYSRGCTFTGFHAGLTVEAGSLYDRGMVIVEDLNAFDCDWAIAGTNRTPIFGYGTFCIDRGATLCNVPLGGNARARFIERGGEREEIEPLPTLPDNALTCPHGATAGDCDACDRLSDQAFDSMREQRFFGGR